MIEERLSKNNKKEEQGRGKGKKVGADEDKAESQSKFVVVLKSDSEGHENLLKVLREANKKPYGREITFRDLALYAIPRLTPKDLEKIQELSLTDMERIQKLLDEHNEKNKTTMSLGEFLVKKLNI
jgi:DNA-binding FadR family transcriptional regulator